eukprot:PhM_4_TR3115/c0_g1_i1/m.21971
MSFGRHNVASSIATFGGQVNPYCNYTSPYAKGFAFKEINQFSSPMRQSVFRLKVRTAAELRFADIVKRYMGQKLSGARQHALAIANTPYHVDHMGTIVPKDEYEVKKMTSYMLSRKASETYRRRMIEAWVQLLFSCEATNIAGQAETSQNTGAKIGTEEEFLAWLWFVVAGSSAFAAVVTAVYWYYKYGQGFEVIQMQ